ncbi:MAG: hypothetical protein LIO86_05010 [Lachnospiraceae bacterium]|nr:hypothetical protein [Lachnospiraceae bacterium]
MRILMLGNSYIFTNDMPKMLAELTGAEVVHHTRGRGETSLLSDLGVPKGQCSDEEVRIGLR